jgi:hypothetical protein
MSLFQILNRITEHVGSSDNRYNLYSVGHPFVSRPNTHYLFSSVPEGKRLNRPSN